MLPLSSPEIINIFTSWGPVLCRLAKNVDGKNILALENGISAVC
jgi:hypothetical protein